MNEDLSDDDSSVEQMKQGLDRALGTKRQHNTLSRNVDNDSCDHDNDDESELEESFEASPKAQRSSSLASTTSKFQRLGNKEMMSLESSDEEDDEDDDDLRNLTSRNRNNNSENNDAAARNNSARSGTRRPPLGSAQRPFLDMDDSSDEEEENNNSEANRKQIDPEKMAFLNKVRYQLKESKTPASDRHGGGRTVSLEDLSSTQQQLFTHAGRVTRQQIAKFCKLTPAEQQMLLQQCPPHMKQAYLPHMKEELDDSIEVLEVDDDGDDDDDIEVLESHTSVTLTVEAEIHYVGSNSKTINKTIQITMNNGESFRDLKPRLVKALELQNNIRNGFTFRYNNRHVRELQSPSYFNMKAQGETLHVTVSSSRASNRRAAPQKQQQQQWGKMLRIKVRTPDQQELVCKLGENQPFEYLIQDVRKKLNDSAAEMKLIFDGEVLAMNDTPKGQDIDDDDFLIDLKIRM